MKSIFLVFVSLSLFGCLYGPPDGSRPLTVEELVVAELVADFTEVPERCRDYSVIGIYQTDSQEDFHSATSNGLTRPGRCSISAPIGECPNPDAEFTSGVIFYSVDSDHWDSLIVLESDFDDDGNLSGPYVGVLSHELHHHFNDCQHGKGGRGHDPNRGWQGDDIEEFIWLSALRGQVPVFLPFIR